MMKRTLISTGLFWVAVVMYILAAVMLYKGHDKMTNYVNSEFYHIDDVNAYVGGDAYNYIINGNYATGFFVLSMGFMVVGTMFIGIGVIINNIPETVMNDKIVVKEETDEEISEKLPAL